jgi:hypothetical protein
MPRTRTPMPRTLTSGNPEPPSNPVELEKKYPTYQRLLDAAIGSETPAPASLAKEIENAIKTRAKAEGLNAFQVLMDFWKMVMHCVLTRGDSTLVHRHLADLAIALPDAFNWKRRIPHLEEYKFCNFNAVWDRQNKVLCRFMNAAIKFRSSEPCPTTTNNAASCRGI